MWHKTMILTALTLPLLWSGPAEARSKDARVRPIRAFEKCLRNGGCASTKQVFHGVQAIADWRKAKRKMKSKQVRLTKLRMVKRVPKQWRARWKQRWGKVAKQLGAAGYRRRALKRLGLGRAVVTVKPRVALAFAAMDMVRGMRSKTEHIILVLWKIERHWRIAYFEDSPAKVSRFLLNRKPR